MTKIVIYSKDNCLYCTKAKNLVKNLGLDYTEKRLEEFESVEKMLEDIGKQVRQMPQIKIDDELIYYLSYGISFAGLLQLIFLYRFVKKYYVLDFDFKFKITNKVKIFFKKLLPSIFSSGVTQINILVGTIIASFQASAVSYLYYADRIYQINLAIAGIAIGVVVLPQLSKHVHQKKKKKILLIQNKALELSMFLSIPASVALVIGSEQIISALFGYGSFDEISVTNSAIALFYFSFLGPFSFKRGSIKTYHKPLCCDSTGLTGL